MFLSPPFIRRSKTLKLWSDANAPVINPAIPADRAITLPSLGSDPHYVLSNNGGANEILFPAPAGAWCFKGCQPILNLATSLTTHSVTVVSGAKYQVTIKGNAGATCVLSGAISKTLTADGTNEISFNNGTPETATTTTLTLTITGTLTEVGVNRVDYFTNQMPQDYVPVSGVDPSSNIARFRWSRYENDGTSVAANGVVTRGTNTLIPASQRWGLLLEGAGGNKISSPLNFGTSLSYAADRVAVATESAISSPVAGATVVSLTDGTTNTSARYFFKTAGLSDASNTETLIDMIVKQKTSNRHLRLRLSTSNGASYISTDWNLATGALNSSSVTGSNVLTATYSISLGNGWFRLIVKGHLDSTAGYLYGFMLDSLFLPNYLTSSGSGFYVCYSGMDEISAVPTSITASTTRSATTGPKFLRQNVLTASPELFSFTIEAYFPRSLPTGTGDRGILATDTNEFLTVDTAGKFNTYAAPAPSTNLTSSVALQAATPYIVEGRFNSITQQKQLKVNGSFTSESGYGGLDQTGFSELIFADDFITGVYLKNIEINDSDPGVFF